MTPTVDVVMAVAPPHVRTGLFRRAAQSVRRQDYGGQVRARVAVDWCRDGAAVTRNRALARVTSEWVAFLDADDEWYPRHLRECIDFADALEVDVVYPGYDVSGGRDLINLFGQPFHADLLQQTNFIPVTVVARTGLVHAAGGFQDHPDEYGDPCEDWGLWLAMLLLGAQFAHLPDRTWLWHMDSGTRGRGDRW